MSQGLYATLFVIAVYYGNVQCGHGSKGRIGIKYDPVHHRIVKVFQNTPAATAGLKPGDIVKHINDKDIIGPSYTYINLTIQRGTTIFTVEVERIPRELVNEHHTVPDTEIDPEVEPETA